MLSSSLPTVPTTCPSPYLLFFSFSPCYLFSAEWNIGQGWWMGTGQAGKDGAGTLNTFPSLLLYTLPFTALHTLPTPMPSLPSPFSSLSLSHAYTHYVFQFCPGGFSSYTPGPLWFTPHTSLTAFFLLISSGLETYE